MSIYREHITPSEPQDECVARIEKEKREQAKRPPPMTTPPTRPAVSILNNGLTMAPMNVVMA